MKKATKKLALVLVAAMVMGLCLVGCGSIVKDTLGDWCVDTVNGQPVAEYAAAAGVTEDMMQFNMKIEEDKITQTGMSGTQEFKPEFKSDGIELHKDGQHVGNLVWETLSRAARSRLLRQALKAVLRKVLKAVLRTALKAARKQLSNLSF